MESNELLGELESVLERLLNEHGRYYGLGEEGKKYKDPTSRYEAWLIASAISNFLLLKEIRGLKKILGGAPRKPKKVKQNKSPRRRRRS